MSTWTPIDPLPQALTANEQRVKALLDQGMNQFQIAYQLHISFEAVREMIYEIRKKECLMAGKPRLSQEERAEIFRLYREEHMTQRDLAAHFDVSHGTIWNIINSFGSVQEMCDTLTAEDKPQKKTQINEDFEQAVDAMIAEREAADAEQKSAIAEPEAVSAEPTPTPKDKLPEAVYRALLDKLNDCAFEIEQREQRIAELQAEIAELRRTRDAIIDWKEPYEK